ncbi:MAG: hypothetical protein AB1757_15150 [Acidobacteriota bacterium]
MTNGIQNKTLEFILEQQAQFAAELEAVKRGAVGEVERIAKLEERMANIEDLLTKMVNIMEKMSALQEHALNNVSSFPNIIAETDERVNLLIGMFERYLSEKHTKPVLPLLLQKPPEIKANPKE